MSWKKYLDKPIQGPKKNVPKVPQNSTWETYLRDEITKEKFEKHENEIWGKYLVDAKVGGAEKRIQDLEQSRKEKAQSAMDYSFTNPYNDGTLIDKPVSQLGGYVQDDNYYFHKSIADNTKEIYKGLRNKSEHLANKPENIWEKAKVTSSRKDAGKYYSELVQQIKPDAIEEKSNASIFDLFNVMLRPITIYAGSRIADGKSVAESFEDAIDGFESTINPSKSLDEFRPQTHGYSYETEYFLQRLKDSDNKKASDFVKWLVDPYRSTEGSRNHIGMEQVKYEVLEEASKLGKEQEKRFTDYQEKLGEEKTNLYRGRLTDEQYKKREDAGIKAVGFAGDTLLDPNRYVRVNPLKNLKLASKGSDVLVPVGDVEGAADILRGMDKTGALAKSGDLTKNAEYLWRKTNKELGKLVGENRGGISAFGKTVVSPELFAGIGDTKLVKALSEAASTFWNGKEGTQQFAKLFKEAFVGGKYQKLREAIKTDPENAMKYVAFRDHIKRMEHLKGIKDADILEMANQIHDTIDSDLMQKQVINLLETEVYDPKLPKVTINKIANPEFQEKLKAFKNSEMARANNIKKQLNKLEKSLEAISKKSGMNSQEFLDKTKEYQKLFQSYYKEVDIAEVKAISSMNFTENLTKAGIKTKFTDLNEVRKMTLDEALENVATELGKSTKDKEVIEQAQKLKQIADQTKETIDTAYPKYSKYLSSSKEGFKDVQNIEEAFEFKDLPIEEKRKRISAVREKLKNNKGTVPVENLTDEEATKELDRVLKQMRAERSQNTPKFVLGEGKKKADKVLKSKSKEYYNADYLYDKQVNYVMRLQHMAEEEVDLEYIKKLTGPEAQVEIKRLEDMLGITKGNKQAMYTDFDTLEFLTTGDSEEVLKARGGQMQGGMDHIARNQEIGYIDRRKQGYYSRDDLKHGGLSYEYEKVRRHKGKIDPDTMIKYTGGTDGKLDDLVEKAKVAKKSGYLTPEAEGMVQTLVEDMDTSSLNEVEGRKLFGAAWADIIESEEAARKSVPSEDILNKISKIRNEIGEDNLKGKIYGKYNDPQNMLDANNAYNRLKEIKKEINPQNKMSAKEAAQRMIRDKGLQVPSEPSKTVVPEVAQTKPVPITPKTIREEQVKMDFSALEPKQVEEAKINTVKKAFSEGYESNFSDPNYLKSLEDNMPATEQGAKEAKKIYKKARKVAKQDSKAIQKALNDTKNLENLDKAKLPKTVSVGEKVYTRSGEFEGIVLNTPRGKIQIGYGADPKLVNKTIDEIYKMKNVGLEGVAKNTTFVIVDGAYKQGNDLVPAVAFKNKKVVAIFDEAISDKIADRLGSVLKHEMGHVVEGNSKFISNSISSELKNLSKEEVEALSSVLERTNLPQMSINPGNNIKNGLISSYPLQFVDGKDVTRASEEHMAEFVSLMFHKDKRVRDAIKTFLPETSNTMWDIIDKMPNKQIRSTFAREYALSNEIAQKTTEFKKLVGNFKVNKYKINKKELTENLKKIEDSLSNEKELVSMLEEKYGMKSTMEHIRVNKIDALDKINDDSIRNLSKTIRDDFNKWGIDEGVITQKELDDLIYTHYFPHMLNEDLRKNPKALRVFKEHTGIEWADYFSSDQPFNVHKLERKFKGSVEKINAHMLTKHGIENFFETNLSRVYLERGLQHNNIMYRKEHAESFIDMFGTKLLKYEEVGNPKAWQAHKDMITEMFNNDSLALVEVGSSTQERLIGQVAPELLADNLDPDIAKKVAEIGFPEPYTVLKKSDIDLKTISEKVKGRYYFVPKESLNMYSDLATKQFTKDKRTVGSVLDDILRKTYDPVQGVFKRYALMSPGFHKTNMMGNYFNSYISVGADILDPATNIDALTLRMAMFEPKNAIGKLASKGTKGAKVMGKSVDEWIPILKEYGVVDSGQFGSIRAKHLADGKSTLAQALNPLGNKFFLSEANETIGSVIEEQARITNFLVHIKNGKSYQEASDLMNKFLFDYSDLTQFENKVIKRIVPFYTFMRKNAPLQLEQMFEVPQRYADLMRLEKVFEAPGETQLEKNLRPRYLQNAVYTGKTEDGKNKYKNIRTPQKELFELADAKDAMSAVSPLLKLIPEMIANKDSYFGSPIEKYDGHKVDAPGYIKALHALIPQVAEDTKDGVKMSPKVRHALRNLIPAAEQYSNVVEWGLGKVTDYEPSEQVQSKAMKFMQASGSYKIDMEKQKEYAAKEWEQKLKDLLRALKDDGYVDK